MHGSSALLSQIVEENLYEMMLAAGPMNPEKGASPKTGQIPKRQIQHPNPLMHFLNESA
jgi:hypothetical protein